MSKKILIIDDDLELSEELAEILNDEGHQAQVCLYKKEDLVQLKAELYDVIILDFKMPDLNGADILRVLPEQNCPKVFLISGRPFVEKLLENEGLLNRVYQVIQKPFSIQSLLEKINSL